MKRIIAILLTTSCISCSKSPPPDPEAARLLNVAQGLAARYCQHFEDTSRMLLSERPDDEQKIADRIDSIRESLRVEYLQCMADSIPVNATPEVMSAKIAELRGQLR